MLIQSFGKLKVIELKDLSRWLGARIQICEQTYSSEVEESYVSVLESA